MRRYIKLAITALLAVVFSQSQIAVAFTNIENSEALSDLAVVCEYSLLGGRDIESVKITTENSKLKSNQKTLFNFQNGKPQKIKLLAASSRAVECVFSSGNRVRVKVGTGIARPYGRCGADPKIYMSLWVNKRKIISRDWFNGNCHELHERAVSYFITNEKESVTRCADAISKDYISEEDSKPENTKSKCEPLEPTSSESIDVVEYPAQATSKPGLSDLEILNGDQPICHVIKKELQHNFYIFNPNFSHGKKLKQKEVTFPKWRKASIKLPEEMDGFSTESVYDFFNDGVLDRVFSRTFSSNYIDGSWILVQHGKSKDVLDVPASYENSTSTFLPCFLFNFESNMQMCNFFINKDQESGYLAQGKSEKENVFFRSRYMNVIPFIYNNTSYIAMSTNPLGSGTRNYVAILKPQSPSKYEQQCLLGSSVENF